MWDYIMIWQAIGWVVLALCSPWIILVTRKISRHFSYFVFPKDTILHYTDGEKIVEAYYIKQSAFKKPSFRKLTQSEISNLESAL